MEFVYSFDDKKFTPVGSVDRCAEEAFENARRYILIKYGIVKACKESPITVYIGELIDNSEVININKYYLHFSKNNIY